MNTETHDSKLKHPRFLAAFLVAAMAVLTTLLTVLFGRVRSKKRRERPFDPSKLQGLSQEEAEARHKEGQHNLMETHPPQTASEIIHQNAFSLFNLNLIALALVQVSINQWVSALLSLGTMVFNIALITGQELFSQRRLQPLADEARPLSTVIRDGKVQSVDPDDLVRGDIVVVGIGDQLYVDGTMVGGGRLLLDDAFDRSRSGPMEMRSGDSLFAGSYCLEGRGAFRVTAIGEQRRDVAQLAAQQDRSAALTPLEEVVERILRVLFLVVVAFALIIVYKLYINRPITIPEEIVNDIVSVVFNVISAGLFFMIVATYAMGRLDIARRGALVYQSRSMESLAQCDILCVPQRGVLTGYLATVEPVLDENGLPLLSQSHLDHLLGDFGHSIGRGSDLNRLLTSNFDGYQRSVVDKMPHYQAYGWAGVAIDDGDVHGTYLIGLPEVMDEWLAGDAEVGDGGESEDKGIRSAPRRLWRRFSNHEDDADGPEEVAASGAEVVAGQEPKEVSAAGAEDVAGQETEDEGTGEQSAGVFGGIVSRFQRAVGRSGDEEEQAEIELEQQPLELIFARSPEPQLFAYDNGVPQPPDNLELLAHINVTEGLTAGAAESIAGFMENQVEIRVFADQDSAVALDALSAAGYEITDDELLDSKDMQELPPAQRENAVLRAKVYGSFTTQQAEQIVTTLQSHDHRVAMVGQRVSDVPPLQAADLPISGSSGSPTALNLAEIVLIDGHPGAMADVLDRGQRIANGLMDILRLYLTQPVWLSLLIVATFLYSHSFPYRGAQGTAIAVFALAIPGFGITFFAPAGVFPRRELGKAILRYILPVALLTAAIGFVLYEGFLSASNEVHYAQLGLTYFLVISGLLQTGFLLPPLLVGHGGRFIRPGIWPPMVIAFISLGLFLLATNIPLLQELLEVEPLYGANDARWVATAVTIWLLILFVYFRLFPFRQDLPGLTTLVRKTSHQDVVGTPPPGQIQPEGSAPVHIQQFD